MVLPFPRRSRQVTVSDVMECPRRLAAVGAVAALAGSLHGWAGVGLARMLPGAPGSVAPGGSVAAHAAPAGVTRSGLAASFRRIILPDLLMVAPKGLTRGQIKRLRQVPGVRNMITFDGAEIRADGAAASVIGVDPASFRSWVPLRTASDRAFWSALERGEFVASPAARARLGLHRGSAYTMVGGRRVRLRFGAAGTLGVTGVDLLVNTAQSRALGLVHRVAALISAPAARLGALLRDVRAILGPSGKIVTLRARRLPVTRAGSGQQPASYLQLFKASAAEYCPGLPWTVLAAIGQIESGDGQNMGPSSAGALGPMQFLRSTWKVWGIDGFGQTGPPDIMNPYDAVPSAARLLCADGAAAGGQSLRAAIYDYNHATWYVNEVLALAAQYAADYR
jgi:hypothetical protein